MTTMSFDGTTSAQPGNTNPPGWPSQVEADLAVQHGWSNGYMGGPGRRRRKSKTWLWVTLAVVGGLVLAVLLGMGALVTLFGNDPDKSPTSGFTSMPVTAPDTGKATTYQKGDFGKPYRAGEVVSLPGWRVTLAPTVSGDKAEKAVRQANEFNERPGKGQTFVMVPVTVERTDETVGTPWLDLKVDFVAEGLVANGWEDSCGVLPGKSLLDQGEMFKGGKTTGTVCAKVTDTAAKTGLWKVEPTFALNDRDRAWVATTK